MARKIYFVYENGDYDIVKKIMASLEKAGFAPTTERNNINFSELMILVMTNKTKESLLLQENSWVVKERQESHLKKLKLMPLVAYDSRQETLEETWQSAQKIYHDLFSDEFKPFAFDLSGQKSSLQEFKAIIDYTYSK